MPLRPQPRRGQRLTPIRLDDGLPHPRPRARARPEPEVRYPTADPGIEEHPPVSIQLFYFLPSPFLFFSHAQMRKRHCIVAIQCLSSL